MNVTCEMLTDPSMYSLTFRVRVTTDEMERRTQRARPFHRGRVESSPACVVRVVRLADYRWALPRIFSVAIATQPVHRLQIRLIVNN